MSLGRRVVLEKVFGSGTSGLIAATAVGWMVDRVQEARRNEPERLDTARLVPGETYLVTTRPPMSRAEAKVVAAHEALTKKQRALDRPNRATVSTAKKLARAQRAADKRTVGSRRQRRAARRADQLGTRFDAMTAPTPQQLRLSATIADLERQRVAYRTEALRSTKPRRRPRTTVYR